MTNREVLMMVFGKNPENLRRRASTIEWLDQEFIGQPDCEDAISRKAAYSAITDYARKHTFNGYHKGMLKARDIVDALPSIEPIRPRGHWIEPQQDDGMSDPIKYQVRCSNCGWDIDPQTWYEEMAHNYCPNCGAEMRGDQA